MLSVLLASTMLWQPAAAQTTPAGEAVGEIIVTAQRRAERLEDIPMAVSIADAETIEKSGAVSLHNLQSIASGVVVSFGGANTQPAIRGITTNIAGNGSENNVAVYIDGFYQGDPFAINAGLANLDNIQILKGPQGTLYGRNATGGAILITTRAPSDVWTGKFQAGYASFDELTLNGFLSGPISDGVRFSLAGSSRSYDGYLKKIDPVTRLPDGTPAAHSTMQAFRAKLEADLTDRLTATLGFNYAKVNDPRSLLFTPFANISLGLPAFALPLDDDLDHKAFNGDTYFTTKQYEGTLTLSLETGFGEVRSYTSYADKPTQSEFDFDGSLIDIGQSRNKNSVHTFQQTVDLNIDTIDNLNLVIGGNYYADTRKTIYSQTILGGALFNTHQNRYRREAFAAYFDANYDLTDKLSLDVGARYSHENADINYFSYTPAQELAGTFTVAPNPRSTSSKKLTPKVSLRYAIAPRSNIYAAYSMGFKSGGWQYGSAPSAPIRPETINAWEVGFKTANSILRFDASAFYYDYKDIQLSVNVPDCDEAGANCVFRPVVLNGPKSEIYGADAELNVAATERMNLRAGIAYLHARYKDFPNAIGTGYDPAAMANVSNQVQDWTGLDMPRAPKFSGNVGVDYNFDTSVGQFAISSTATFSSSYIVTNPSVFGPLAGNLARKQRYRENGYININSEITWTEPSEHFSVTLFVRNLTNERYFASLSGSGFGDYGALSEPRAFGGRIEYKF